MNNVRTAASASRQPRTFRVQRRGPPSYYEWAVVFVSGECYPVLWIGQTAVVTLPAEIDVTNAGQVREVLLSVLNQGAVVLIADLSTTTFCDSAGVSALARTFRRADASHSEMRLVVSTPAVKRILAITGIDRLLDIYPGVTAALGSPDDSTVQSGAIPGGNTGGAAPGGNTGGAADTDGGAA